MTPSAIEMENWRRKMATPWKRDEMKMSSPWNWESVLMREQASEMSALHRLVKEQTHSYRTIETASLRSDSPKMIE